MSNDLSFELIQVAIRKRKHFSNVPSEQEWEQLYRMAEKQSVLGVCFRAVKEMADSVPQPLYLQWLATAAKIQQLNEEMNRKCAEVYAAICKEGFECAVLKGQGVAELYNLNLYRQSGDIDVWLWKEELSLKENRKEVIRFARTIQPDATGAEHHVGVEWMGTEVELHYEPVYFCNPFANRRLRKWFCEYDKSRFHLSNNGFCVPDAEFNRVFLLAHAFRHYMSEGLGLRQVMDYYFLLLSFHGTHRDYRFSNLNANSDRVIKELGMAKFEKAMKWVIEYVFEGKDGGDGRKYGKILLRHIMDGGNFGKHKTATVASRHTHIGQFINQFAHDIRLMRYYPSEAIWAPLSMIREFIRIRI